MTQGAAAPDGYEITHWERRNWLDATALWLKEFGTRHKVAVAYAFLVAMTFGLMYPYFEFIFTPIGIVLTLAAVVPITVVMFLFWRSARGEREPVGLLVRTFLLGACFAVVAALVNTQLGWLSNLGFLGESLLFLFVVGPGEEVVKLAAVWALAFHRRDFDRPVDGIYYGVAAGAGFAALENIMYVFNAGFSGGLAAAWGTAILRALISTPGHAIWTGFAGYYLGLAKFNPENRGVLVVKGLMIVAFVHGMFDIVVSAGLGVVGLILGAAMHVAMFVWLLQKARGYYAFHGIGKEPMRRVPVGGPAPVVAVAASPAAPAAGGCASCGTGLAPGARFCPSCGARTGCAQCGTLLQAGQRFCAGCGAPVATPQE